MRGNQITTLCAGVGFVLALAALAPIKASAQSESELYHDRWTKPFCMQPYWDEKKWEEQNMRWDIKDVKPAANMSDVPESVVYHDRWYEPFAVQPYWDEGRWENRNMRWDIKDVGRTDDLSDVSESALYHDSWAKPFCMQPYWDEARWEEHCIYRGDPAHYRHSESSNMEYRSE